MNSFYGGRKGESFVIVKRFATIEDMNNYFQNHANLDEVGYGQYVIIDTVLKSNFDNGKLYRRGFEGAEYVGQIVGPQGPAPEIELVNYNSEQNWDVEGSFEIPYSWISGKDLNSINYRWSRVEDENKNFKGIQLGLQIPYHVFKFGTQNINWWESSKIEVLGDSTEHYHNYQLYIPSGLPGATVKELEVITEADGNSFLRLTMDYPNVNGIKEGKESYITIEYKVPFFNVANDVNKIVAISTDEPTRLNNNGLWFIQETSKSVE